MEEWFSTVPPEVERRRVLSRFLQRLSRDELPALRYAVGAALGDGDYRGRLRVADWDFARAYAAAIATLTGDPVKVWRRDGHYRVECRLVGFIAKSPLWKTVAFLDRLDERKHFLAGLMDAEGSVIPIVDRKNKDLRVRVLFTNTDYELIEYVRDALKELGFEPNIKVVEPGDAHVKRGGVAVRRKKSLYKVYADLNPSKIEPLAKVGFNCWRKRLLLDFFLKTASLTSRQRYEEFTRCWRKIGSKWWPVVSVVGLYVVECNCGEAGTFELRRETERIYIRVHHESGVCELVVAEKEVREGESTARIKCPRCGRPGYVYVVAEYMKAKYWYLVVGVGHKLGRRTSCRLASLRILSIRAQQP